ncbi:hypothetical protein B0T09DRAFT_101846 [Sordaria sp. MPI-SDFR-AT-0083]|nr:hypothetical protein B0T09DRAFT_101846 [Sordaria sp. MPI-SDFR-AT-0083]
MYLALHIFFSFSCLPSLTQSTHFLCPQTPRPSDPARIWTTPMNVSAEDWRVPCSSCLSPVKWQMANANANASLTGTGFRNNIFCSRHVHRDLEVPSRWH